MKGDKWYGRCVAANDNFTLDKVYEVEEDSNNTNAPMRGVNVQDDNGNIRCMFASRFERTTKTKLKPSVHELVNDPEYITVYTSEKYLNVQATRLIKKKTLRKIVSEKCESYLNGQCNGCFIDAQELEYGCFTAWSLTIGKGKKIKT